MFGAILCVDEWLRYRKRLSRGWKRDVTRLLAEDDYRARHRRSQRGRWLR